MRYFLCVLGMVMIVEGLPYFVSPEKMKAWIMNLTTIPNRLLQRMGFALMIVGLILVFFGRPI